MRTARVVVLPYDRGWETDFEKIKSELLCAVGGLALASAVSSVSIGVVLLVMINKRKKGIIDFSFVINLLKTLGAATLSAIVSGFVYGRIDGLFTGGIIITLLKLCVSSFFALAVYVGAGFLLKVDECMFIRRIKADE